MACTTILVGKAASYDGSTMIARNDDSGSGHFTAKKFTVIHPEELPKTYRSVLSHVEIPLPEGALRFTAMPNAVEGKGIWAASGVNAANVGMTATETITSNPRVLGADPLVEYQPAKGVQNVVMVTIGTGVGGGVIVNGDVVSGVVGAGGEIGHMCLNPAEERTCGCGGHGHLEQYSSATGVVSNYLAECKKAGVEPIELTGPSDSKDVFQACREGDKLALAAADTMADYLGRALALIANVVDPEMFLIGGGASASADVYLDKVREHFKQYALSASRETPIKVASLGNDAGIIGAAYVALRAAGK